MRRNVFLPLILALTLLAEYWVCLGPPCLDHTVIVGMTLPVSLGSYFIVRWIRDGQRPSLFLSSMLAVATFLMLMTYFWLFIAFTIPLPDHCHRDVGSWDLTSKARDHLARHPGMSLPDLLADMGSNADEAFTSDSLKGMRILFIGTWLILYISVSALLALFGTPPPDDSLADIPPLSEDEKASLRRELDLAAMAAENETETEKLFLLSPSTSAPTFNVIFVHGVDGHWRKTWCSSANREEDSWPTWMASEFPDAAVWSLHYHASTTHWWGGTMPLPDRARNVLFLLDAEKVFSRPTIFIVHSFGGLVVKSVWRQALDMARADVKDSVKGIAFLATPHAGARLASYLGILLVRLAARPSITAENLRANQAELRELNTWYANHHVEHNLVFFETQPIVRNLLVVDEHSANPGIAGVYPVGIYANHMTICKPRKAADALVKNVNNWVKEIASAQRKA